jgi:hypothetical protein
MYKQNTVLLILFINLFIFTQDSFAFKQGSVVPLSTSSAFEQAEAAGLAYVAAIQTMDKQSLSRLFDSNDFPQRVAKGGGFNRKTSREYKKLFKDQNQKQEIIGNMFVGLNVEGANFQLRKIMPFKGIENVAMVRAIFADGSMEYYFLEVNEKAKIVDMFQISRGMWLSDSVGQMTALVIGQGDSFFKKLTRSLELNTSAFEYYQPFFDAYAQGGYEEAHKVFLALPDHLRQVRQILELAVFSASNLSEQTYVETLEMLNQAHGNNPELAFMLMDLHATKGDYAAVVQSLNLAMQLTGDDAHLLDLRGTYHSVLGNSELAFADYTRAVEIEPSYIDGYWSLADYHNGKAQYAALTQTLQLIMTNFEWQITAEDLQQAEGFEAYVQSNEFQQAFIK